MAIHFDMNSFAEAFGRSYLTTDIIGRPARRTMSYDGKELNFSNRATIADAIIQLARQQSQKSAYIGPEDFVPASSDAVVAYLEKADSKAFADFTKAVEAGMLLQQATRNGRKLKSVIEGILPDAADRKIIVPILKKTWAQGHDLK